MNRALKALKCTAASAVLLHATDLNPLWLIEPYGRWFGALVFYNRGTAIIFLASIFVAFGVLVSCLSKTETAVLRSQYRLR